MKNISRISVTFICLTIFCAAVYASEKIRVGIDYSGIHETREAETQWTEGVTVQ